MSDVFIRQYRRMAAGGGNFRGLSVLNHADQIGELIRETRARTLLDWGSGAGDAYREPHKLQDRWGITPTLYDPAFDEHDELPTGTFDGVICSDVLEHILDRKVDKIIRGLFEYAERFVWASVCCRPAKKHFPDGRNLHITVREYGWWWDKFEATANGMRYVLVETP